MWLGAWGERGGNSLKNEREVEEAGARRGKQEAGGRRRGKRGREEREVGGKKRAERKGKRAERKGKERKAGEVTRSRMSERGRGSRGEG